MALENNVLKNWATKSFGSLKILYLQSQVLLFFFFYDLHVRHKVAIILAGIREISGKIAFEPVRGLIIIKAFEFCSLIDLNI